MMNQEAYQECLAKLRSWCSLRDRASSEVRERGAREGLDGTQLEAALQTLRAEHYIDDERFAASFVSGHVRIKKWGRIKVRQALRQKGISDALIQAACRQEIDEDDYLETLKSLLQRKAPPAVLSHPAGRQKLTRYALQKGYEYELIAAAINELEGGRS